MKLKHISHISTDAFLAELEEARDIDYLAKKITDFYSLITHQKPKIKIPKEDGLIKRILEIDPDKPVLELEIIGYDKSRYFFVNREEGLQEREFREFHKNLYEVVNPKKSKQPELFSANN